MAKLTVSEYEYILQRVVANAKVNDREAAEKRSDYNTGYRVACYEILDIIKSELETRGADVKEFGLDFALESLL